MPVSLLRAVMPVILIAVALFFALKPGLSDLDRVERIRPAVFTFTAVPMIAAYDGFFGPGTGSFFMLGFVLLAGFGVLKATAHTKLLNFASNIGSLLVFVPSGSIWWAVGIAMALAQAALAILLIVGATPVTRPPLNGLGPDGKRFDADAVFKAAGLRTFTLTNAGSARVTLAAALASAQEGLTVLQLPVDVQRACPAVVEPPPAPRCKLRSDSA